MTKFSRKGYRVPFQIRQSECIPLHFAHHKPTMIVPTSTYELMVAAVIDAIRKNLKLSPTVAIQLGVEHDALMSLYGQMFVRCLKVELRSVSESTMQSLVKRAEDGESLVALSDEFHFGSFKFAKLYLEAIGLGHVQLSSIMTDPNQIQDHRLKKELLQLLEMDPVCSHELEQLKECLGREYEELLINLLNQKKMCFETEQELRSRGKPKTPDILFLIPMAIKCNATDVRDNGFPSSGAASGSRSLYQEDNTRNNTMNGSETPMYSQQTKVVINWIDSKAMFADAATFKENLDQFRGYNNRYGRGMVIYWHGFVEDVGTLLSDDMIILRDHFPEEWTFPTGEVADGRVPAFDNVPY